MGKSVLVVDDDEAIVESVSELLRDESYDVRSARNGREALALLRKEPLPGVILLDLMMPEMDGYEFRRLQRADPALSTIPTVVFTAGAIDAKLSEMAADAWLRKPIEVPALLTALECTAGAREAGHEGESSALGADVAGCHLSHLYEDDAGLMDGLAPYVAEGVQGGDALLLVVTPPHLSQLTTRLSALGIDLTALRRQGQAAVLDAESTLEKLMAYGRPARARFEDVVGQALRSLLAMSGAGRVRAFGEMVDLLWRRGDVASAIDLEDLWNRLAPPSTMTLLCAYAARSDLERQRLRCVQSLHGGQLGGPTAAPRGNWTAKVEPRPGTDSTVTEPPMASTSFRTT